MGSLIALVAGLGFTAQAVAPQNNTQALPNVYIQEVYVPTPEKVPTWTYCSCVEYAKSFTGHQGEVWGFAGNMQPNSSVPSVDALVLTTEGSGHVGVVTKVASGSIEITEANYIHCQKSTRTLSTSSPVIRGYKVLY